MKVKILMNYRYLALQADINEFLAQPLIEVYNLQYSTAPDDDGERHGTVYSVLIVYREL